MARILDHKEAAIPQFELGLSSFRVTCGILPHVQAVLQAVLWLRSICTLLQFLGYGDLGFWEIEAQLSALNPACTAGACRWCRSSRSMSRRRWAARTASTPSSRCPAGASTSSCTSPARPTMRCGADGPLPCCRELRIIHVGWLGVAPCTLLLQSV